MLIVMLIKDKRLKKLLLIYLWIGVFFFFGVSISFSEPYRHTGMNLTFPDQMADMHKVKVADFEMERPGLGVAIAYNGPGIIATIYLYNMGMVSVPEDTDSPVLQRHFMQAIEDVFQVGHQGLWKNTKKISEDVVFLRSSQTNRKALCASFSYSRYNTEFLSKMCLFAHKNHFIKIRFTYRKDIRLKAEDTFKILLGDIAYILEDETVATNK